MSYIIANKARGTFFKFMKIAGNMCSLRWSREESEAHRFADRKTAEKKLSEVRVNLTYPADLTIEEVA